MATRHLAHLEGNSHWGMAGLVGGGGGWECFVVQWLELALGPKPLPESRATGDKPFKPPLPPPQIRQPGCSQAGAGIHSAASFLGVSVPPPGGTGTLQH